MEGIRIGTLYMALDGTLEKDSSLDPRESFPAGGGARSLLDLQSAERIARMESAISFLKQSVEGLSSSDGRVQRMETRLREMELDHSRSEERRKINFAWMSGISATMAVAVQLLVKLVWR